MRFEDKGVLVTGATSGIGAAIADRLGSEGASVVVSGRNRERGEAVAARVSAAGPGRAVFIPADLSTADGALGLARAAGDQLERIDVLVNNAATGVSGPSAEVSSGDWAAIYGLNVRAPYLLATHFMPQMAARRSGAVVNVTSAVAYRGWPGYAMYSASKAALDAMTKCWAATYGLLGVRVNAVAPGPVVTPRLVDNSPPEAVGDFGVLVGRYGDPAEIAVAVAYVASSEADYLHGTTLHVDGGMVEAFGYTAIPIVRVPLEGGATDVSAKRRFGRRRPR